MFGNSGSSDQDPFQLGALSSSPEGLVEKKHVGIAGEGLQPSLSRDSTWASGHDSLPEMESHLTPSPSTSLREPLEDADKYSVTSSPFLPSAVIPYSSTHTLATNNVQFGSKASSSFVSAAFTDETPFGSVFAAKPGALTDETPFGSVFAAKPGGEGHQAEGLLVAEGDATSASTTTPASTSQDLVDVQHLQTTGSAPMNAVCDPSGLTETLPMSDSTSKDAPSSGVSRFLIDAQSV